MVTRQVVASRPHSLRLNIAANYAGQVYVAVIGIAMVPVYLHSLGPEALGLIGFFALVQSWAQLVDLGFSASVSREASRFAGGELSAAGFRRVLRPFERFFWALGVCLALTLALQANRIGAHWLHAGELSGRKMQVALQLMAVAVAMRWVSGLYRGVLSGVERQVWLNAFTAAVVTLRFVLVVPVIVLLGGTVTTFFAFQILVAALELGVLWRAVCLSAPTGMALPAISWHELRPILRFSAGVGVATIVWVVVTQADKLVISAVLSLSDFGFFTAAVNAASAVSMLSVAVTQGMLPRLIHLDALPDRRPLFALYERATRFSVAFGGAIALTLMTMGEPLLWAWTGNRAFASAYGPVLALYAAGNAFMVLAAFPYSLQYAGGNLRLHVLGNLLLAVIVVPVLPSIASAQGALGTGKLWLAANAGFVLLWTPFVHRRFAPGLHLRWLLRDVLLIAAIPCVLAAVATAAGLQHLAQTRIGTAAIAGALFVGLLVAGAFMIDEVRQRFTSAPVRLGGAPSDSQTL